MNVKTIAFAALCALCGCVPSNKATEAETEATAALSLDGRWEIAKVALNDSVHAIPAELTPEASQYIVFNSTDSTYSIRTNCNTIGGSYIQKGDSLSIGDGFCTEMACDNMEVEDLIKQILSDINTIEAENDSTIRLNATREKYIELRRVQETV